MKKNNNIPEYYVSQFNKMIKGVIESNFDYLRIKGEISEIKNATKGQIYLTLKDDDSILSGVIWEPKKNFLKFYPEIGMEVIVTGKITTWSRYKTTYQIDIDQLELAGEGALLKLIENRKKKLQSKGIFDLKHKKNIPFLPEKIGVITSPSGSVIHDIINRIKDRFPVNLDLWPVAVQGEDAVENIIAAINGFNSKTFQNKPDVIIIARGGGSTEDLMAFNNENLAMTVFNSKIPIISAIGHETDNTIIDYVSDLRASTPTAAAEKAVPLQDELIQQVKNINDKIFSLCENIFEKYSYKLQNLNNLLKAPNIIINSFKERFDKTNKFFDKEFALLLNKKSNDLKYLRKNLNPPESIMKYNKNEVNIIVKDMHRTIREAMNTYTNELHKFSRLLKSNSISSNLKKGYTIISKSKKIIKKSNSINEDDLINVKFYDHSIELKVKKIN
tara:strand:- start:579 stop:1913 length:1335 start_codon:yes stop_codon:yes gene_type:complete